MRKIQMKDTTNMKKEFNLDSMVNGMKRQLQSTQDKPLGALGNWWNEEMVPLGADKVTPWQPNQPQTAQETTLKNWNQNKNNLTK